MSETSDTDSMVIGPFTVAPAIDPYNGRPLNAWRINGHCSHLSAGANRQYWVYRSDAIEWCNVHLATYH